MGVQLRCTRRLVASVVGAAGSSLALLLVGTGASAQAPAVTVKVATLEDGAYVAGPLFGGNETLQYEITVTNPGAGSTGLVDLYDTIPKNSLYVEGSATCGTTPNCLALESSPIPKVVPFTVSFLIGDLAPDSSAVVDFEVTPRSGALFSKLSNVVHWSGGGCASAKCSTGKVKVPVIPRPVLLSGVPLNGTVVATGEQLDYGLVVRDYSSSVQHDVVVTDVVPPGTEYVAGSATCVHTPGCSASEAGGVVSFSIASVPPGTKNRYRVGFWVTVTSAAAPVTDVASWTGDLCEIPVPCSTNQISYPVIPGPPPTTTTTAPPKTKARTPPPTTTTTTTTSTTTTTTTTTLPVTAPPVTRSTLALSPATIPPGGSTVASGAGCPPGSLVAVSIDGKPVSTGQADSRGDFSISLKAEGVIVGVHTVTAACGDTRLTTTLTIVVTSAGNSPESSAGYFGVFVLLGAVLLRGQFVSDIRTSRRRRRAEPPPVPRWSADDAVRPEGPVD